jgi:hypothetical protein
VIWIWPSGYCQPGKQCCWASTISTISAASNGGIYRHEWLLAQVSRLRRLLSRGHQGADLAAGQRKLLYYVGDRDGPILDEAVQALARAVRDVADRADASAPGVAVAAAARYIRESRRNWFRGSRESKRQRQQAGMASKAGQAGA